MPFYPTADLDDGYDIAEHYGIDPRLGTFGDFTEFVAHGRVTAGCASSSTSS